MSRGNPEAVKVVFIDTQYVETDATSFKSVVQKLTGKDSAATATGLGSGPSEKNKKDGGGGGSAGSGSAVQVESGW
ncbi:hypothetical protein U1Q18_000911 [Sarracenia purpurea var. burkii]